MNAYECGYVEGAAESGHPLVYGDVGEAQHERDEQRCLLQGAALAAWEASWDRGYSAGKEGR